MPYLTPYLKLRVEGKFIALWGFDIRNFRAKNMGIDPFREKIGQN